MTYTTPQHNRKRGHPLDVPTHWQATCYGCTGYGDNPLTALAKATANAERWYAEYPDTIGLWEEAKP